MCMCVCRLTFALWWILAAVSQHVNLIDRSVRLEQLPELLLGPGPRNLAHKHLNGIDVRLVGVVQRPVHLLPTATQTDRQTGRWVGRSHGQNT